MKNLNITKLLLLSCLLVLALSFSGCTSGQPPAADPVPKDTATSTEQAGATQDAAPTDLSDWNGQWTSLVAIAAMPENKPALEALSKTQNMSADEIVKFVKTGKRHTDYAVLKIDGSRMIVVDEGGKEISQGTYTYVASHESSHGPDLLWYEYTSKDATEPYQSILMMEIHDEENLPHYHMRYGKDAAALVADGEQPWYPALFNAKAITVEQVEDEIAELFE